MGTATINAVSARVEANEYRNRPIRNLNGDAISTDPTPVRSGASAADHGVSVDAGDIDRRCRRRHREAVDAYDAQNCGGNSVLHPHGHGLSDRRGDAWMSACHGERFRNGDGLLIVQLHGARSKHAATDRAPAPARAACSASSTALW